MLICYLLVTVHLFASGPSAARGPTDMPSSVPAPEELRSQQAKQLYIAQRFVESARAYEALYNEFRAPKYLFNAAAAREGAGQDAHSFVALRRFLNHPGLRPEQQAIAEARLQPLRRRTTTLQLEISPAPRPGGIEVSLRRTGVDTLLLDGEALAALDQRGVIEIQAEEGDWSVRVEAPGYDPLKASLHPPGVSTAQLSLEPVITHTPPTGVALMLNARPTREGVDAGARGPVAGRPTAIGLGVIGSTGQIAGAIIIGVNASRFRSNSSAFGSITSQKASEVTDADYKNGTTESNNARAKLLLTQADTRWKAHEVGAVMMGAGVGLGVGALTKLFEARLAHPRRAWIAEAITGGGLAALGFTLSHFIRDSYDRTATAMYCNAPAVQVSADFEHPLRGCADLKSPTRLHPSAMQALHLDGLVNFAGGLGIGLVVSGVVGLTQMALHRRRPTTSNFAISGGTSLQLSF